MKMIKILLPLTVAACATTQYGSRLVPYAGGKPSMPAAQVADICRAQASSAYSAAAAGAQGQVDARNNTVTGYNCSSYGQATAYGNQATYNGATNCGAVTANPYGGKYGAVVALGDAVAVMAQAEAAQQNTLIGCAASYGYRVEKYCVSNCPDAHPFQTNYQPQTVPKSPSPPATSAPSTTPLMPKPNTTSGGYLYPAPSKFPSTDNDELCRVKKLDSSRQDVLAELRWRGVQCAGADIKAVDAALSNLSDHDLCIWSSHANTSAGQRALAEVGRRNLNCAQLQ